MVFVVFNSFWLVTNQNHDVFVLCQAEANMLMLEMYDFKYTFGIIIHADIC